MWDGQAGAGQHAAAFRSRRDYPCRLCGDNNIKCSFTPALVLSRVVRAIPVICFVDGESGLWFLPSSPPSKCIMKRRREPYGRINTTLCRPGNALELLYIMRSWWCCVRYLSMFTPVQLTSAASSTDSVIKVVTYLQKGRDPCGADHPTLSGSPQQRVKIYRTEYL